MIDSITPSQISSNVTAYGIDIEKAKTKFEDTRKFLQMGKIKVDNKPFHLELVGEVTTKGIAENKWEDKATGESVTKLSLGFSFSNDEDLANMELFLKAVEDFCDPDYELTSPVKDNDIIYFQIKDIKNFNALSNKKSPTIRNSQAVIVTCNVKFYMNFKEKKAGYVLQPIKFVFED